MNIIGLLLHDILANLWTVINSLLWGLKKQIWHYGFVTTKYLTDPEGNILGLIVLKLLIGAIENDIKALINKRFMPESIFDE